MAFVALQDVLGAPQLCGTIQATKTGIPDVLPPGIFETDKVVEKDYGEYERVKGTRTAAPLTVYGGPAKDRVLKTVESVPVKLMHTAQQLPLPMANFRGLIQKDSTGSNLIIDTKGVQEIGRQVREARKTVDNLVVAAQTQALVNGAIYFDGQGNLLPNSGGAVTTPSFGVPAGNQGQLNVFGTGNILTAGWQTASTDIAAQVIAIRDAAVRLTGYPIKHALYGSNIPSYLTKNNTLTNFFSRGQQSNEKYLTTGEIPNPLLGLTWWPAHEAFFEDQNAVNQSLVGPDSVTFFPDPSSDWSGGLEGKYDVPGDSLVGAGAMELLATMKTMEGMFAYATVQVNPVRISLIFGHTFLPTLKVGGSVFQANVNF